MKIERYAIYKEYSEFVLDDLGPVYMLPVSGLALLAKSR